MAAWLASKRDRSVRRYPDGDYRGSPGDERSHGYRAGQCGLPELRTSSGQYEPLLRRDRSSWIEHGAAMGMRRSERSSVGEGLVLPVNAPPILRQAARGFALLEAL